LIAAGQAAVQDEASQLAALLLARAAVLPPEGAPSAPRASSGAPVRRSPAGRPAWLDMCAGPGGKARMLRGLAALTGARLVAADVHPHRARLVASAAGSPHPSSAPAALPPASAVPGARAGTPGSFGGEGNDIPARVVVADGRWPAWRDGAFDRV